MLEKVNVVDNDVNRMKMKVSNFIKVNYKIKDEKEKSFVVIVHYRISKISEEKS